MKTYMIIYMNIYMSIHEYGRPAAALLDISYCGSRIDFDLAKSAHSVRMYVAGRVWKCWASQAQPAVSLVFRQVRKNNESLIPFCLLGVLRDTALKGYSHGKQDALTKQCRLINHLCTVMQCLLLKSACPKVGNGSCNLVVFWGPAPNKPTVQHLCEFCMTKHEVRMRYTMSHVRCKSKILPFSVLHMSWILDLAAMFQIVLSSNSNQASIMALVHPLPGIHKPFSQDSHTTAENAH